MVQGKTATWQHESGVPEGDGDRDTGGHEFATTIGGEHDVNSRAEVHPCVSRVRSTGQGKIRIEPENLDIDHHNTIFMSIHVRRTNHARSCDATPSVMECTVSNRVGRVLVWMDLEMTGLDPEIHVIVEIATLITDDELNIVAEGPEIVIHQPEERMARMDDFVTNMHKTSGLLDLIGASTVTETEAMERTLAFIKQYSPESGKIPLAGNSIRTDRAFLAKYMPDIEYWLHYRCVDVSTIKELVKRWYPGLEHARPSTGVLHRAMDDIKDSVAELRYYRDKVFRLANTDAGPAQ